MTTRLAARRCARIVHDGRAGGAAYNVLAIDSGARPGGRRVLGAGSRLPCSSTRIVTSAVRYARERE